MCTLYRMTSNVEAIRRLFGVTGGGFDNLPEFPGIYPDREAPVIRTAEDGARALEPMRWGFPPPPAAGSRPVVNVRNLASPFWRTALTRPDRRCLVPVTAFCEWEGEAGAKRRRWFAAPSGDPFAFAGIWRPAPEGPRMAFLTCAPNALVGAIHPRAMPVVLAAADYACWLEAPLADILPLARPCAEDALTLLPA